MTNLSHLARLAAAAVTMTLATVLGGPVGCDGGDEGTTGRRLSHEVRITSSDARQAFTNAHGWSITLSRADLAVGALYFFDGATIVTRSSAGEWSLVRSAFAHPGHYVPGEARGELLGGGAVDLRVDARLGVARGVSGIARSATFSYRGSTGTAALGGHAVVLEGTAARDGAVRPFRFELDPDDVVGADGRADVEGCPFAEVDLQADGVVTVDVQVSRWLDQADFGGPVAEVRRAVTRGTRTGLAYRFSYAAR